METIKNFFIGLSWFDLALLAFAVWYVARHGLPATLAAAGRLATGVSDWWNAETRQIKAVQTALAADVATLKNDVDTLKSQITAATRGTAAGA